MSLRHVTSMVTCCAPVISEERVKAGDVTPDPDVYTITEDSLPSHMRSLLPSHEQYVDKILTHERTRSHVRCAVVAVGALLVLTTVVVVVIVVNLHIVTHHDSVFTSHDSDVTGPRQHMTAAAGEVLLAGPVTSTLTNVYNTGDTGKGRTPCVRECWAFSAFRFSATCQNGFCQCHSDRYDSNTCLPNQGGCHIKAVAAGEGAVRLLGIPQVTYTCRQAARHVRSAHIISIFGNHRAPATHVTVKENSSDTYRLVLVSYHPVTWQVHLPVNTSLDRLYLVSPTHTLQSAVSVSDTTRQVGVTSLLSVTGYGQDKNGGHTPELLGFLQTKLGHVTSFLGVPHADHIELFV